MSYEHILYDVKGRIATVTLNRPDKLNAYTATMGAELEDAFLRADEDDEVRVVIVTGAGRGFCAGADISAGANAFDTKPEDGRALMLECTHTSAQLTVDLWYSAWKASASLPPLQEDR